MDAPALPAPDTTPQWRADIAAACAAWPGVPPAVGSAIRSRVEYEVFGRVPGPAEGDAPEVLRHPMVLCIVGATSLAGWGPDRTAVLYPLLTGWARGWGYTFDADGRYVASVWSGGDWPRV